MHDVPLLTLHALAAPRGDGLHPDLLSLLERSAAVSDVSHTVSGLAQHPADGTTQSELDPAPAEGGALPDGVLLLPADPLFAKTSTLGPTAPKRATAVRR